MSNNTQQETGELTPAKNGQWHWLVIFLGIVITLLGLPEDSILYAEPPPMPPFIDFDVAFLVFCLSWPILAFCLPWLMKGFCYAFVWDGEEYPNMWSRACLYLCYFSWWLAFYHGIGILIVVLPTMLPVFEIDNQKLFDMLSQSVASILAGWNGQRIFRPILAKIKTLQLEEEQDNEYPG